MLLLTDSGDTVFYGDDVIAKDLPLHLRKATSALIPIGAPPACSTTSVTIGSVQGPGDVTPRSGQTVTVRGTVVGDHEGPHPTCAVSTSRTPVTATPQPPTASSCSTPGNTGNDVHFGGAGGDCLFAPDGVPSNDTIRGGTGRDLCTTDPGDTATSCP